MIVYWIMVACSRAAAVAGRRCCWSLLISAVRADAVLRAGLGGGEDQPEAEKQELHHRARLAGVLRRRTISSISRRRRLIQDLLANAAVYGAHDPGQRLSAVSVWPRRHRRRRRRCCIVTAVVLALFAAACGGCSPAASCKSPRPRGNTAKRGLPRNRRAKSGSPSPRRCCARSSPASPPAPTICSTAAWVR